MAEKVVLALTTPRTGLVRIRERSYFEQIGSYKYVIESLSNGSFNTYQNKFFHKEQDARTYLNNLYHRDVLFERSIKAISKVDDDFEESLKGTKEYDFFKILELFEIHDYQADIENNSGKAICSVPISSYYQINEFLKKYNYPTSIKSYEIEDHGDGYAFIIKPHTGKEHCLFFYLHYEYESDYQQYKLLFDSKLRVY